MPNFSLARYNLIWHVEHGAYNQREHALKTRVEISEQRSLRWLKNRETKISLHSISSEFENWLNVFKILLHTFSKIFLLITRDSSACKVSGKSSNMPAPLMPRLCVHWKKIRKTTQSLLKIRLDLKPLKIEEVYEYIKHLRLCFSEISKDQGERWKHYVHRSSFDKTKGVCIALKHSVSKQILCYLRPSIQTSFTGLIFFALTWRIIYDFENLR